MEMFKTKRSFNLFLVVFLVAICALCLTFTIIPLAVNAEQELISQKIKKEFKVPMGGKLSLDLGASGDISVTGWAQEVVKVQVFLRGSDWKNCRVDFHQNESDIIVSSDYRKYRHDNHINARFTIMVPRRFNLELNTTKGGITLKNIEGVINGETKSGKLNLSKLTGEVHLSTMGGNITVKDSNVDGEVKTMGGQVIIENLTGGLKGSTMGGSVVYKNVTARDDKSSQKNAPDTSVVFISTMGGPIEVEDAPAGADLKTMGGNIHIRSAGEFVKANTMGGNIDINAVDGWVEAVTMGGNVNVKMIGDPARGRRDVLITSMGGDISLVVPPALSMDIDITIAYTRNSRHNYAIHSDFPVQIEKTANWEYSKGSERKYIYGAGRIAGGKDKIKIETINGNVYLKKGKI